MHCLAPSSTHGAPEWSCLLQPLRQRTPQPNGTPAHRSSGRRASAASVPAGCWVEVGVRDGQLVDIRPDTGHPLGMICRRGEHAPEIVHSEHRLRYPLRRTGPKGTHEFERISWDEAYDLIVENLQRDQGGVRPRGGRDLHRPRRLRAVALRHVPAQGRGGLVGLQRALPLRLAQHHGRRRALLRLLRHDRAARHDGPHAGQHVHRHRERRAAGGVGRQPGHRFAAAGHAPAGGRGQARRARSSSSIRAAPRPRRAPAPSGSRSGPAPTAPWRSA